MSVTGQIIFISVMLAIVIIPPVLSYFADTWPQPRPNEFRQQLQQLENVPEQKTASYDNSLVADEHQFRILD